MNPKLKKILAIIALVFMGLFVVSLMMYLINQELFGGYIGVITFFFFGVAFLIFLFIYFVRGFPGQQVKDAEKKKLHEEYLKKLEENNKPPEDTDGGGNEIDGDESLEDNTNEQAGKDGGDQTYENGGDAQ